MRVFHGPKPKSSQSSEKQSKKESKQAAKEGAHRHSEKTDGAAAKDLDDKGDEVRLALFCVCTPFTPFPSIDSLQKESIFKTKHKIDLAFTTFDAKYVLL